MSTSIKGSELTAHGRADIENEISDIVDQVLKESIIPTMGKKLIIEASTQGHFPGKLWEHFGINNMPPWSINEQVSAIIECVKAGASAIHSHPIDPSAPYRYEAPVGMSMSVELITQILDKVYQQVDVVPLNHAWNPKDWEALAEADFITHTRELLDIGKGNKYIQGNVVPTWINPRARRGLLSAWFTANSLKEGLRYLEDNNVKPLIAMHIDHLHWFKNSIVDAGVMKTRPHLNIQEGKHGVDRSFVDPMSHLNLINSIEMVRKVVPDCTIGIHAGGRNWLPMTVLGIMLGVDLVRIGIENQFWACPHKGEIIKKPAEAVKKVVQIATALGRDIATTDEAREILGITVTSPK